VPASGMLPMTGDWYGDGNFTARAENDYLIDRARQATHNFTGLEDATPIQDAAMQESMGPIVDRSREHLSASDAGIIRVRRRLMLAAEALAASGKTPPGADQPALYRSHGEQALVGPDGDWEMAYAALIEATYANI
jgi:phthalate 4,5-dioxygenase oxygenase subunit